MKKTRRSIGGFAILALILLPLAFSPAVAMPNGTETIITTDTTGSFQKNPAIDGTLMAWDDQRAGGGVTIIYAYDLQTGNEYPVLPIPPLPTSGRQHPP